MSALSAILRRMARSGREHEGDPPNTPRDRSWTLPNGQPRPLHLRPPSPPPVSPAERLPLSTVVVRLTVDAAASPERIALANLLRREWPFLDTAAILEIQTIVQASRDLRRSRGEAKPRSTTDPVNRAHADRG